MVCLADGDSERARAIASGLEERGRGRVADSPLFISGALEPLLEAAEKRTYKALADGAGNVADIAFSVGRDRQAIIDEVRNRASQRTSRRVEEVFEAARAQERIHEVPGDLEDLSGGTQSEQFPEVDSKELARLRHKLDIEKQRLEKTIADAHAGAARWQKRRDQAAAEGGGDAARHAERNADLERARMHNALAELGTVENEIKRLERAAAAPPAPKRPKAPASSGGGTSAHGTGSVDDLLRDMKKKETGKKPTTGQKARKKTPRERSVDAELRALKSRMNKGPGKP
jgi:hypothetical protein